MAAEEFCVLRGLGLCLNKYENEKLILRFSAYGAPHALLSDQFFGWILGFGKKAKLLYPDDVIDQFRGYMDKIREMY